MNAVFALISLAVVLQTLELFFVRPWNWQTIKDEMPLLLRPFLKFHGALLGVRLIAIAAAALTGNVLAVAVALVSTWLINVRWRGTFNGGSDAMTFQVLLVWLLVKLFGQWEAWLTAYLTFILVLSYFVAGLAKVKERGWRDGSTLNAICAEYGLKMRPGRLGAWGLMLFELSFPLAVLAPWVYLPLAVGFHLGAVYTLGLNRFFFVWIAVYPILFEARG